MTQCNKCNFQYIGEAKRHPSDRLGEHRRAIEKAITQQHIDQRTAVSDRLTLPTHVQHRTRSSRKHHLKRGLYSKGKRSISDLHGQDH